MMNNKYMIYLLTNRYLLFIIGIDYKDMINCLFYFLYLFFYFILFYFILILYDMYYY